MTSATTNTPTTAATIAQGFSTDDIIGPFSQWPRSKPHRLRIAGLTALAGGLGVFLHCVVPLLTGT